MKLNDPKKPKKKRRAKRNPNQIETKSKCS